MKWLVPRVAAAHRRLRPGPAGLPAEQLHPRPDRGGADQRGRRSELRCQFLQALLWPGHGRRHHARGPVVQLHQPHGGQHRHPSGAAAMVAAGPWNRRRGDEQRRVGRAGSSGNRRTSGRDLGHQRPVPQPLSRSPCSSPSSPPSSDLATPSGCSSSRTSSHPLPSRERTAAEPCHRWPPLSPPWNVRAGGRAGHTCDRLGQTAASKAVRHGLRSQGPPSRARPRLSPTCRFTSRDWSSTSWAPARMLGAAQCGAWLARVTQGGPLHNP